MRLISHVQVWDLQVGNSRRCRRAFGATGLGLRCWSVLELLVDEVFGEVLLVEEDLIYLKGLVSS